MTQEIFPKVDPAFATLISCPMLMYSLSKIRGIFQQWHDMRNVIMHPKLYVSGLTFATLFHDGVTALIAKITLIIHRSLLFYDALKTYNETMKKMRRLPHNYLPTPSNQPRKPLKQLRDLCVVHLKLLDASVLLYSIYQTDPRHAIEQLFINAKETYDIFDKRKREFLNIAQSFHAQQGVTQLLEQLK